MNQTIERECRINFEVSLEDNDVRLSAWRIYRRSATASEFNASHALADCK